MTDQKPPPPKPAPDAMREALIVAAMQDHFKSVIEAGRGIPFKDTKVDLPTTAFEGYAKAISAALSAPVPPADGAGGWSPSNANLAMALRDLENKVAPCWFLIVEEAARRLSPPCAGAAEPVVQIKDK